MPDGYFRNMPDDPYFKYLSEVTKQRPSSPPKGWYYHPELNKYVRGRNPQKPDPHVRAAEAAGEFARPGDFNLHRSMAREVPKQIGQQRLDNELRSRGLEYFGDLEGGTPSSYRDYNEDGLATSYHKNELLDKMIKREYNERW